MFGWSHSVQAKPVTSCVFGWSHSVQAGPGKPVTRHKRKQAPYSKPTRHLNIEVWEIAQCMLPDVIM